MINESVQQFALFHYHPDPLASFFKIPIIPKSAVRLDFGVIRVGQHTFNPFVCYFRVTVTYDVFVVTGGLHRGIVP